MSFVAKQGLRRQSHSAAPLGLLLPAGMGKQFVFFPLSSRKLFKHRCLDICTPTSI